MRLIQDALTGICSSTFPGRGQHTVETRVAVIDESKGAREAVDGLTPPSEVVAPLAPPAPASAVTPPAPVVDASRATSGGHASGVVASPVVRRILNDGGVEPSTLRGSGPGGSITRRDAERAVAQGPTEEVVLPLSNGRRRMGQHMSVSSQGTPHGFVAVEVDGALFAKLDGSGRVTRDGEPISDEMVVSLAAVRALAEFEFLNATYVGDELTLHRTVNLGVVRAVADDGMLVPVVHAAAGLTLRALARRVNELDERVASRQLTADDLMGGTFTIAGAPTEHTRCGQSRSSFSPKSRSSPWERCASCPSWPATEPHLKPDGATSSGFRSIIGSVSPREPRVETGACRRAPRRNGSRERALGAASAPPRASVVCGKRTTSNER